MSVVPHICNLQPSSCSPRGSRDQQQQLELGTGLYPTPQNSVEALDLSAPERDLIWKWGLHQGEQDTIRSMRRVSWKGEVRSQMFLEGGGWEDTGVHTAGSGLGSRSCQPENATPEAGGGKAGSPSSSRARPSDTLVPDFWPPALWRTHSCSSKSPGLWCFVLAALRQ